MENKELTFEELSLFASLFERIHNNDKGNLLTGAITNKDGRAMTALYEQDNGHVMRWEIRTNSTGDKTIADIQIGKNRK